MSVGEVLYRLRTAVQAELERGGFRLAEPDLPNGECGAPWSSSIARQFDVKPYLEAADRVLAGEYSIFRLRRAQIGFPPDWNKDPLTGIEAPLEFGKILDYRKESKVGNIKYLWEINRHLEFVTLAQAWHLTQDRRYADGCKRLLESWFEQCPYPLGVNWASSLELGLRLVNWSFGWHLLGGDDSPLFEDPDNEAFRDRWLQSIYEHLYFIVGHKSRYSSANNHLLGELLGVLVGTCTWPLWPETERWCKHACQEFEREVLLQNTSDGVNREQAVWYHHEVMDMMFIAAFVGRANKQEFSEAFWDRLEAMAEYLASLMDFAGNVASWGDSDDAVMVRFCPHQNHSVYESILASASVVFDRSDFKAKARIFDEKSRWLLGDAAAAAFDSIVDYEGIVQPKRSFPEAGYYILGSNFGTAQEMHVTVDAGPLGYLSIAAHGHADALAMTLSVGGNPVLIDPGTYAYHTEQEWRDYFRGTSAHNTVRVDSQDQSVPGGNFLWTDHARAECLAFECSAGSDRFYGEHDGYLRLKDPTIHRREILFEKTEQIISVIDEIQCRSVHLIEIFWHFSANCDVQMHNRFALVQIEDFEVKLIWPSETLVELVCGQESPPLGWSSNSFDTKVPSRTIVVSKHIASHWIARTTIQIVRRKDGAVRH
jgi:hypothetical protein